MQATWSYKYELGESDNYDNKYQNQRFNALRLGKTFVNRHRH